MELVYDGKKPENDIIGLTEPLRLDGGWNREDNLLIMGDNLPALKTLLSEYGMGGKVDLIYVDPPFATGCVFKVGDGRTSTMSSSLDDEVAYSDDLSGGEFIEFLRERLVLARELLSERGSIYLHTDCKVGHYIKVMMDEVFGSSNFRNDIARIKCNPKNFDRRAYGNIRDMVLFYSKSKEPVWNSPKLPYTDDDIEKYFNRTDSDGRRYLTVSLSAPGETKDGATGGAFKGVMPPKGRHWTCDPKEFERLDDEGLIEWSDNGVPRRIVYVGERDGKKMQDVWEFKDSPHPTYPTEKNFDMLKTIISASSEPGGLVMDFFCGSGSTLAAAQELGRRWVGVDRSPKAMEVTRKRMDRLNAGLFGQGYAFLKEK